VFIAAVRLNAKPMFIITLMLPAIGSSSSESIAYAIDIEVWYKSGGRGKLFLYSHYDDDYKDRSEIISFNNN